MALRKYVVIFSKLKKNTHKGTAQKSIPAGVPFMLDQY